MSPLVLVVDDERKIRELVRSYLERAGIDVLTTGSGAEALALAGRRDRTWSSSTSACPTSPGRGRTRSAPRRGPHRS